MNERMGGARNVFFMMVSLCALAAGLFDLGGDRMGKVMVGVVGLAICSGVAYLDHHDREKKGDGGARTAESATRQSQSTINRPA